MGFNPFDVGMKELAGLKGLTYLDLNFTKVTDVSLKEFRQLKSLNKLYVAGTVLSDVGVAELQKALPACKIVR